MWQHGTKDMANPLACSCLKRVGDMAACVFSFCSYKSRYEEDMVATQLHSGHSEQSNWCSWISFMLLQTHQLSFFLAWFMIFYSSEAWKWKGCDPLLPSTFFLPSSNIIPDSMYIVLFPTFPSLLVSLIGILPSLLIWGFVVQLFSPMFLFGDNCLHLLHSNNLFPQ